MSERSDLLTSMAATIGDYREGEIAKPTCEHVERWVCQFASGAQLPILREIDHVLRQTYLTKAFVSDFLRRLIGNPKLAGADPCAFWKDARFLRIQRGGHSQIELLALLDVVLRAECRIDTTGAGGPDGPFIYLDDTLFSGSRAGGDLSAWIKGMAPSNGTVHILVIASHTLGEWQAMERLKRDAAACGKTLSFDCWRAVCLENRKAYRDASDVLWPASLPDDAGVAEYAAAEKKFPFEPRQPGAKSAYGVFSSEDGRQLLEREFLLAGVSILGFCESPRPVMRPLGFSHYGVGFGSMIVTYRNCPNNCPLALWWGDPQATRGPLSRWYPLVQRKTYEQASH